MVPLPSSMPVPCVRMMAFDWLVAETCGGTQRHSSLQAPWKQRFIQLVVTVTQTTMLENIQSIHCGR